jgi:hypothetical protein
MSPLTLTPAPPITAAARVRRGDWRPYPFFNRAAKVFWNLATFGPTTKAQ